MVYQDRKNSCGWALNLEIPVVVNDFVDQYYHPPTLLMVAREFGHLFVVAYFVEDEIILCAIVVKLGDFVDDALVVEGALNVQPT